MKKLAFVFLGSLRAALLAPNLRCIVSTSLSTFTKLFGGCVWALRPSFANRDALFPRSKNGLHAAIVDHTLANP